jgi:hypothetical protein
MVFRMAVQAPRQVAQLIEMKLAQALKHKLEIRVRVNVVVYQSMLATTIRRVFALPLLKLL